jgi:cell division control protein 6
MVEVKKEAVTFSSILSNSIYKDRDVLFNLQPPSGFLHRIDQKNELVMELAPILMNSSVSGVFVYGMPGTGKTALILELLKEIEQEAKKRNVKLNTAYINCSENRTETSILLAMLSEIDKEKEYPKIGWNRAKTVDEFNKILNSKSGNYLMVLDEVDYALRESGDDILYRLSRLNDDLKTKLSTIIISNDVRVQDYIKPRTQSAFGRVKIVFSPYTSEELFDIMKDRAKFAFKEGVVGEVVLKKIAEIEAGRGGDARKALELLDASAKLATADKQSKVSLDLVEQADRTLEKNHVLQIISSLAKHQKILYLTILKSNKELEMEGAEIYREYMELCSNYGEEPLSERRVRSFLIYFDELGLIDAEVGWLRDMKKKARKITVNLDKALKTKALKLVRNSI